jgi:hypothetical protein
MYPLGGEVVIKSRRWQRESRRRNAPGYEPEGREFESLRPLMLYTSLLRVWWRVGRVHECIPGNDMMTTAIRDKEYYSDGTRVEAS